MVNAKTGVVERSWDNIQSLRVNTLAVVGNEKIGKSLVTIEVEKLPAPSKFCRHKDDVRRIEVKSPRGLYT